MYDPPAGATSVVLSVKYVGAHETRLTSKPNFENASDARVNRDIQSMMAVCEPVLHEPKH